jgi:outer membrane protein, heavy metal efflux system
MKNVLLYTLCLLMVATASSQNSVDTVLGAVAQNNKALQANKKYWEARKQEFRTGLTPYDPLVEYDYLLGSPADAGNQRDFAVTQRLDFPTTYNRKRALSREQVAQADWQHDVARQEVLLQAKLTVLELICLNKIAAVLGQRQEQTARLVADYQKKLDRGDVIILEVNKARLQLLNIQNEEALNQNERQAALTRLAELNGGIEMDIRDTVYPAPPVITNFEELDSLIEAADPLIKTYEQEKVIQQQQVAVQRALNLPKMEAGYHSQGILGQSYKGVHAGITVPLWENKNRVRAAQANLDYAVASAATHRLEHRLENKRLYDQLAVRTKAMREYNDLVATLNNTFLLDKALRLGQITVIQYFQEESYYFSAYNRYLQMELEYHKAIAQLFKFRL